MVEKPSWFTTNAELARRAGAVIWTSRLGRDRWSALIIEARPDPHHPGDYLLGRTLTRLEAHNHYQVWKAAKELLK